MLPPRNAAIEASQRVPSAGGPLSRLPSHAAGLTPRSGAPAGGGGAAGAGTGLPGGRQVHWRRADGGGRHGAPGGFQARLAATGQPDLDRRIRFSRRADELGIDSLLTDFGWSKPDPLILA